MVSLFLILGICAVFSVSADTKTFRWCARTDHEMTKCNEFKKALPGLGRDVGVSINPDCVKGSSADDCIKKIRDNVADFVLLNGGKIYEAGKSYGLVPIVAEDYGPPGNAGYYTMAVARKETNITINTLKGRKSCHTGYRRSSGWNIPIGYLLQNKMARLGCGDTMDAQSAAGFFSKSCVPGAPKEKGLENLCALCPAESKCASSSENKYSGHSGSFKCMAEKQGEVAFLKLPTTLEVLKSEDGAKYGNMSDYKYLCKNGKSEVVSPTAYKNCSLAYSPAHAVVTRPGDNKDYIKIFLRASKYCRQNTTANNCSGFYLFESVKYVPGKRHLIFKDLTIQLVDVKTKDTYKKYLGEDFINKIESLGTSETCGTAPVSSLPAIFLAIINAILALTVFL